MSIIKNYLNKIE